MREIVFREPAACQAARLGMGDCGELVGSGVVVDDESGRPWALCAAHRASVSELRMVELAEAFEARIASVHERRACPRCGAPKGRRCTRVGGRSLEPLKGPHRERWEQEVPAR